MTSAGRANRAGTCAVVSVGAGGAVPRSGGSVSGSPVMRPAIPRARPRSGRTGRRCRGSTKSSRRSASTARTCSLPRGRRRSRAHPRLPRAWRPTCDTMNNIGRSSGSDATGLPVAPLAVIVTRAPSELPMVFPWRADSSARFTSSRIAISRCQRATRSRSSRARSPSPRRELGEVDRGLHAFPGDGATARRP